MKKLLLSVTSMALMSGLVAQNKQIPSVSASLKNVAAPMPVYQHTGMEVQQQMLQKPNPTVVATGNKALNHEVIGTTTYDLQSNATVQRRIVNAGSGNLGATWTFSQSGDLAAPDRGTGYNRAASGTWAAQPSAKAEASTRTGWSSYNRLANGGESSIAHKGQEGLWHIRRNPAGSGAWTEGVIVSPGGQWMLWNRSAVGGSNGNTIHVVAITAPEANGGTIYNGYDGCFLYFRSQDGGQTWDINGVTPPQITTAEFAVFRGDGYAIDARGDVVAIAVFNSYQNSFILKSTDNGDTWTKTNFLTTGLMAYNPQANGTISDVNNDGIADTISTTDNAGAVLIDNNNQVHVWYGRMRVLDDDPGQGANSSFFPGTNGLDYWNESMNVNAAVTITGALDLDGNNQLDILDIPLYFTSLSSFPSAGISSTGVIFLTYSAIMETLNNGNQNYRHIYAMHSNNGGANWSDPVDLNYDSEFDECMFASLARTVDNRIHVVYQRDAEPGLAVRGDEDPFTSNDIVYLWVDTLNMQTVGVKNIEKPVSAVSVYPNPATDMLSLNFSISQAGNTEIRITNLVGQQVSSFSNAATTAGSNLVSIDVSNIPAGVYFVSIVHNGVAESHKFIKQ